MSGPPPEQPGAPVFFQRRTYRRRRLQDAARILPVIAVFVWLIPLLWPRASDAAPSLGSVLIYMFGTWAALILIGAILSRRLTLRDAAEAEQEHGSE